MLQGAGAAQPPLRLPGLGGAEQSQLLREVSPASLADLQASRALSLPPGVQAPADMAWWLSREPSLGGRNAWCVRPHLLWPQQVGSGTSQGPCTASPGEYLRHQDRAELMSPSQQVFMQWRLPNPHLWSPSPHYRPCPGPGGAWASVSQQVTDSDTLGQPHGPLED